MSTILSEKSEDSTIFPKQPEVKVFLKKPETRLGMPNWYHRSGAKMNLMEFDKGNHRLVIASDEASITITPRNNKEDEWKLEWRIENRYTGLIFFTSIELKNAFGLTNDPGKTGFKMIEKFGADSAEERKYIRYGDFLNIPGANEVNVCNISVYVDDEMRSAIRKLLPF